MKMYLFIALILMTMSAKIQGQAKMKIENYSLGEKEVVIFPFGMDQKITVGKIDDAGNLTMDWSKFDISAVKNTDMHLGDYSAAFDYYCDENVIEKGIEGGAKTVKSGYIYLWNETRWVGILIPASSVEVKDRILDEGGKHAVVGSYLNWIYASEETQYYATCKEKKFFYGGTQVETAKIFKLDLKKGWNTILFQIDKVVSVKDAADTPVITQISTIESYPDDIIWFLKKL